jgi:hypothetical protein
VVRVLEMLRKQKRGIRVRITYGNRWCGRAERTRGGKPYTQIGYVRARYGLRLASRVNAKTARSIRANDIVKIESVDVPMLLYRHPMFHTQANATAQTVKSGVGARYARTIAGVPFEE